MKTVGELIKELQKFDPEDTIKIQFNYLRVHTEIHRGLMDDVDIDM